MRKTSHLLMSSTVVSVIFLFCCTAGGLGQNRERFVISAQAGGVNAVTGEASVHSKGETEWQQLMITDDLQAGDRVRTAGDGRVEILLNPGSYLRVGGNSEVELANNSLANLEVRLIRGTAIVEATGADGLELNINISTPHARLAIVRGGLYRVNVVPGDNTELIVRKGRVILNDSHTKVKGGNKVVFNATTVSVAKLTDADKKTEEAIDSWSKGRAETLAKANRRINNSMMTSAFASYSDFDRAFWGYGRSSGLWFYSARLGCYTFLPYYYGFGSPYGSSYSRSIYAGVPAGTTNNYPAGTTSNNPSTGSSQLPPVPGTSGGGGGGTGSTGGSRMPSAPPMAPPVQGRDPDTGTRILRERPNNY